MFLAAAIQTRSGTSVADNLSQLEVLVGRAASAGATLVGTPENSTFLGPPAGKLAIAEPLDGATGDRLAALARRHRLHLLVGSVAERGETPERCYNTSVLYGPDGDRLAVYRKIHLFDVDIPGGPRFTESAHIASGDQVVVADTPLGQIGLSICYDIRFPELYRKLRDAGATLISVPSAFTRETGANHWHVLLRARAIETQCFVLAPAQEGRHDEQGLRHSYGHSLIVDPWGTVLADCPDGPGVAIAWIDPQRLVEVRRSMPVAAHRRL